MTAFETSFEGRVLAAREASVALYLDNPSPEAAALLVTFEQTVRALRADRQRHADEAKRETETPVPS